MKGVASYICFLSLVTGDSLFTALLLGVALDTAAPVSTHLSRLTCHILKNSVVLQKAKMQCIA